MQSTGEINKTSWQGGQGLCREVPAMVEFTVDPGRITLFGLSHCPYCNGTRKYFKKRGIDFDYVEVDSLDDDEREKVTEYVAGVNKRKSFPTVVFGDIGEVVVGYEPKHLRAALEKMQEKYPDQVPSLEPVAKKVFGLF